MVQILKDRALCALTARRHPEETHLSVRTTARTPPWLLKPGKFKGSECETKNHRLPLSLHQSSFDDSSKFAASLFPYKLELIGSFFVFFYVIGVGLL